MTKESLIALIKETIHAKRLTHMNDRNGDVWIDAEELYQLLGDAFTRKDEDYAKANACSSPATNENWGDVEIEDVVELRAEPQTSEISDVGECKSQRDEVFVEVMAMALNDSKENENQGFQWNWRLASICMAAIRPYLRTTKPVMVSLESLKLELRSKLGPFWEERAKAVLDAAGVKYAE